MLQALHSRILGLPYGRSGSLWCHWTTRWPVQGRYQIWQGAIVAGQGFATALADVSSRLTVGSGSYRWRHAQSCQCRFYAAGLWLSLRLNGPKFLGALRVLLSKLDSVRVPCDCKIIAEFLVHSALCGECGSEIAKAITRSEISRSAAYGHWVTHSFWWLDVDHSAPARGLQHVPKLAAGTRRVGGHIGALGRCDAVCMAEGSTVPAG